MNKPQHAQGRDPSLGVRRRGREKKIARRKRLRFPLAKLSFPCDLVSPPSWHSVLLFLGSHWACRLFYLLLASPDHYRQSPCLHQHPIFSLKMQRPNYSKQTREFSATFGTPDWLLPHGTPFLNPYLFTYGSLLCIMFLSHFHALP